jgi:hypothetical protein
MEPQGEAWLFRAYLLYCTALTLGGSLLLLYFQDEGFSVAGMLLIMLGNYLGPLIALLFLKNAGTGKAIALGAAGQAVAYLALGILGGVAGAAAYVLLAIPVFLFFWVPFNTLWFRGKKTGHAFHGAIYYAIPIMVGIIGPSVAGAIAGWAGFPALFAVNAAVLFIGASLASKNKNGEVLRFSFRKGMEELSGLKTLLFLEGFSWFGSSAVAGIITLEYFSEPAGLGAFITTTTLIAVALSLVFARISDRKKRMRGFIVFSSAGFGAAMVAAAACIGAVEWFWAFVGIVFFRTVFSPFPIALISEKKKNTASAMYGREIMLNAGRAFAGIVAISVYLATGELRVPLAFMGAGMLLYAAVFEFSKKNKLGVK